jgi:ketol-acid reductoisomerase
MSKYEQRDMFLLHCYTTDMSVNTEEKKHGVSDFADSITPNMLEGSMLAYSAGYNVLVISLMGK